MWVKKDGGLWDVTMGSFGGAEISELVDIFLLHQFKTGFPTVDFGLYRDDGLGHCEDMPGPTRDKMRKDIIKLFKDNRLNITIEMNAKVVNFLDCTFNLEKSIFHPFRKDNSDLLYINSKSNHPPGITKQLPTMVEQRSTNLSSSREQFVKAKSDYEKALGESGFKTNMKFTKQTPRSKSRAR